MKSGGPPLHKQDARKTSTRFRSTLGQDASQELDDATIDGRNGITDDQGFTLVSCSCPRISSTITDSQSGTTLRSVAQVRKIKVFVSRLEVILSPDNLKAYVREY